MKTSIAIQLAAVFVLTACASKTNQFSSTPSGLLPTVALAPNAATTPATFETISSSTFSSPIALYLDGSVIHFHCFETQKCFSDVDLGVQIKEANNPLEHPLSVVAAYHGSDANLYVFLTGGIWNYLAKVNLETGRSQILDLNILSSSAHTGPPNFFPGMGRLTHNKIVVLAEEKAGILQDDFTLKTIDIKEPIRDIIETNDSKITFLSQLGNDKRQGKVFLVDVDSDTVEEKTLNFPQDTQVVTVDNSLRYLYWVSFADKTLHLFDIQAQKDIRSTPLSDGDFYAYSTLTVPLYQYHGILYSGGRCPCEGPIFPSIRDMSTLKSVVNPQELLKNETGSIGTFIVAPFGDNFLIGMTSHVLVVSPNGTIVKTYDLPKELVGRNYLLLEYRK